MQHNPESPPPPRWPLSGWPLALVLVGVEVAVVLLAVALRG